MSKKLRFVGDGFVPGYPAQDFTCEDDKIAAELVKGGAYKYADEKKEEKEET